MKYRFLLPVLLLGALTVSATLRTSAQTGPTCQPLYAGVVNVTYTNGNSFSNTARVNLPANCDNPSIVTNTLVDSVLCGTGSGPSTCVNTPGSNSQDIHSYVANISNGGFDVFLSGDDNVWVGASSPQFPISYQVMCGANNVPVCADSRLVSGVTTTGYYNGQANSVVKHVDLPSNCGVPVVVAQSYTDSVLCGTGAGPATCINTPASASADIHASVANPVNNGFDVFLTSDDNVWVGGSSPAFPIAYQAMCQNPVGNSDRVFGGVTSVTYNNGQPHSNFTRVNFPESCPNPVIKVQTYQESLACGTGAGPATCLNNSGTTSTDIHAYVNSIDNGGFSVFLSSDDLVWVGASSPQLPIAYHVTCKGTAQSSSSSSAPSCRIVDAQSSYAAGDHSCTYNAGSTGVLRYGIDSEDPIAGASDCGHFDYLDLGSSSNTITLQSQWNSGDSACVYACPSGYALVNVEAENPFTVNTQGDDCSPYQCRFIGNGGQTLTQRAQWDSGDNACVFTCPSGYGLQTFVNEAPFTVSTPGDDCNLFTCQQATICPAAPTTPQCRDGLDNDGDGAIDYPNDFSCSNPDDNDETNPKAQCQDGADNDGDGKIDSVDPGCHFDGNAGNPNSYNPQDNDEFNAASSSSSSSSSSAPSSSSSSVSSSASSLSPSSSSSSSSLPASSSSSSVSSSVSSSSVSSSVASSSSSSVSSSVASSSSSSALPQCRDGLDNDGDGVADHPNDFSCSTPDDNDETNPKAQCQDGVDNDGDGLIDFPTDPGCTSRQDNSEFNGGSSSSSSSSSSGLEQCRDGIDNDSDGKIDALDPGCHFDGNAANLQSYNPYRNSEVDGQLLVQTGTNPFSVYANIVNNNTVNANSNANSNANANPSSNVQTNPSYASSNYLSGGAAQSRYAMNNKQYSGYDVQYIALLPQTGIESFAGALASVEGLLSPIQSAASPSGIWVALSMLGLSAGGTIGRKFFL